MEDKDMMEIIRENHKRAVARDKAIRKQKEEDKQFKKVFIAVTIAVVILMAFLIKTTANDMEQHIETVSTRCAEQGQGITAKYTKEGDKYYVCKEVK